MVVQINISYSLMTSEFWIRDKWVDSHHHHHHHHHHLGERERLWDVCRWWGHQEKHMNDMMRIANSHASAAHSLVSLWSLSLALSPSPSPFALPLSLYFVSVHHRWTLRPQPFGKFSFYMLHPESKSSRFVGAWYAALSLLGSGIGDLEDHGVGGWVWIPCSIDGSLKSEPCTGGLGALCSVYTCRTVAFH